MMMLMASMESGGGAHPPPPWRDPKIDPKTPEYDEESSFFTCSIHHGGVWTHNNGMKGYEGGEVACFDYCDTTKFNVLELHHLVTMLGKEDKAGYWFVPYNFEMHQGMDFSTDFQCGTMFEDMKLVGYTDCQFYIVSRHGDEAQGDEAHGDEAHSDEGPFWYKQGRSNWWIKVVNDLANKGDLDEAYLSDNSLDRLEVDEDGERRIVRRCVFKYRDDMKWDEFTLLVGMEFANKDELRAVLKEVFISKDWDFKVLTTNKQKFRAVCAHKGCKWVCYARVNSRDKVSFRINTLIDEHDCPIVLNSRLVDAPWLAKHYESEFRLCPKMTYRQFLELATNTRYSHTSSSVFYQAKRLAEDSMKGTIAEQYAVLYDYCINLVNSNPGTTAKIMTEMRDNQRTFLRVYICLAACKNGFKHCRQVIGLDGTFLKGFCKGVLLAAVGIDADNGMFPIAWAVCETEDTTTWTWFLGLLRDDLDAVDGRGFTLMSDKQKGLENAQNLLFNGAEIRHCARHLESNLKSALPGLNIDNLFWKAAKASTPEVFKATMDEIKAINENAWEWLGQRKTSEWSMSEFEFHNKSDIVTNNNVESFNKCVLPGRDQPILHLLEQIRDWLMTRLYKKRLSVASWRDPVGPNVLKVIEKLKKNASRCSPRRANQLLFQVVYRGKESFSVNLTDKVCTCKGWQRSGIPCYHALACIWAGNGVITDYIDDVYKQPTMLAQYAGVIAPMTSPDKWPGAGQHVILPPVARRMPGRPKMKRKRQVGEVVNHGPTKASRVGQINRCSNCRLEGHSRRTCTNASTSEVRTPNRRGRPAKENMSGASLQRKQRKARQRAREQAEQASQNPSGSAPQPSQGLGSQAL